MRCCPDGCRGSVFVLQLPPCLPAGCTNAVTTARLYSTAHRRRLLIVSPLCRRLAGVYFAGMWPRGTRESNGRGPAATTAMWPAVWPGGRPSPGGRRAITRRIGLSVRPQRQRRPYHQPKRPATGRWRTNNRQRVDAAPAAATGSCPNGGGVSRRGRDSVRSTWRGHCRALVEGDLFPC